MIGTANRVGSSVDLRANDGFTLIELLVALIILGVVMGGLTQLFVSALRSETDQTNRVGAQQDARLALEKLRREIHCASGVSSPSATSLTISLPSYCSNIPSTTLNGAVTLPTGTIPVASTAKFNTGANTISIGTSGDVACAGTTATTFTGCSGGSAGTYPTATAVTSPVTWCTTGSSAPYRLARYVGIACSGSSGRPWADSLTSGSVFAYNRSSLVPAPTSLVVAANGGTLTTATYAYDVTAVLASGLEVSGTIARTSVMTGKTNQITVNWGPYAGATAYRVYGRDDGSSTSQGLRLLATTGPGVFSYVDTGSVDTSTVPTAPPLATVSVTFATDKSPQDTSQQFALSDDIVLRNSGRF